MEESAHRSPSPWPHDLEITETQTIPVIAIAPEWSGVDRKWWDPRPRITITIAGRVMGGRRAYRFWTRAGAQRRVQRFLDAGRRIYRQYGQITAAAA